MQTTAPPGSHGRLEDPAARANGRSVAELLADLWRESTSLVQDELALAKAEMAEKGRQFAAGAGAIAQGGAILLAGFIVLLLAAANALAMVLPQQLAPWLAPLIVGAIVMLIGYAMLAAGRRKAAAEKLQPTRSIDSLRQDRHLVREHMQ